MEVPIIITHALLFVALYAEVFLLMVFLETEKTATSASVKDIPSVCIVVPCFNEEKTVAATIRSLLALDYPKDKLRIVAVNDGSTDHTATVLSSFAQDPRITVISKKNGGKYSAMNVALATVHTDYIGCLDADSFVAPDALRVSMARLSATGAVAVTPAILVYKPRRIIELVQQAEYSLSIFVRNAFAKANAVFITPGPFSIFRRDVLANIGGWRHAHGTEDMEIAMRLQQNRQVITNSPRTRVYTVAPRTLRALYKQRVRWTYGFLMNSWDYRHMVGSRTYGSLGTVILPAAIISIGAAIYFTGVILANIFSRLYSLFVKVDTVGISVNPTFPLIDPFFINTTSAALVVYVLVALAVSLILTGQHLSGEKIRPIAIPLYILSYGFLAPLWLTGAIARTALRAQAPWR